MDLSVNSKSLHLNKTTYINLRWIGIIGQFITINSVAFIFKFEFNFILANLVVLIGALSNIFLFYFVKKNQLNEKISLATVYNTVRAFEKKGYLKQIPINSNQTYFDTNISDHHHFYDLNEEKLIDLENSDVGPINIYRKIGGKKIKSVEVLVKLED